MNNVAVYTLTSGLHNESSVSRLSDAFLGGLFPSGMFDFRAEDFSDFGTHNLDLIYVRTGGAEGIFKELLPSLLEKGAKSFYLLTSGKSNSLAASLEILSYLKQNKLGGEVLHGSEPYLIERISLLERAAAARNTLRGTKLGVIGKPSDWLISSQASAEAITSKLGVEMVEIPMDELITAIGATTGRFFPTASEADALENAFPMVKAAYPGADRIYEALVALIGKYGLGALTLRCFDLLTTVRNTGCLALARLNAAGMPSACEGDIPALLSMMIAQAACGVTGFQANPSSIDVPSGEILFAHCTVPYNLVTSFHYDTHFESGIGVGIHGELPKGPVTVFKVSGDLERSFVAEGKLERNQYEENLCRTQVVLRLSPEEARYFLTEPIGNHHIVIPGHHGAVLRELLDAINGK